MQSKPGGLLFECFLQVLSSIENPVNGDDFFADIEGDGDPPPESKNPHTGTDIVSQRASHRKSAETLTLLYNRVGVAGGNVCRSGRRNFNE
jgi:hypothetical protein